MHAQRPDFEGPQVAAVRVQRALDERRLLVPDAAPVAAERRVVPGFDLWSGECRRADAALDAYVALQRFEERRGIPLQQLPVSVEHMAHGVRVRMRVGTSTRRTKVRRTRRGARVADGQVIVEQTRPVIKGGGRFCGRGCGPLVVWDDRRGVDLSIACGERADYPAGLPLRVCPRVARGALTDAMSKKALDVDAAARRAIIACGEITGRGRVL